MRWLLAAALLLVATPTFADEPLPSRDLMFPPFVVQAFEPMSFELIDFRADERQPARNRIDVEPHSLFVIKRYIGVAGGYDNGISRGSIGLYLTVAEWGRWNFGSWSIRMQQVEQLRAVSLLSRRLAYGA